MCVFIYTYSGYLRSRVRASKLSILLEKADQCPKLKHIVKIGDVSEEDVQNAGKFGITIKSLKDVEVMLAIAHGCYLRFTYCLNK